MQAGETLTDNVKLVSFCRFPPLVSTTPVLPLLFVSLEGLTIRLFTEQVAGRVVVVVGGTVVVELVGTVVLPGCVVVVVVLGEVVVVVHEALVAVAVLDGIEAWPPATDST
jgi:hypothetical protein